MHHTQNSLFKRNKFDTTINRHQKKTRIMSLSVANVFVLYFGTSNAIILIPYYMLTLFYIAMIILPGGGSNSEMRSIVEDVGRLEGPL